MTLWTGLTTAAPVTLTGSADGNAYAVNGYQRGVSVIGGTTAYPIGLTAPSAVSAASFFGATARIYVTNLVLTDGGENYHAAPGVGVTGVAAARARMIGDAVGSLTFTTSATTHQQAPEVDISGGQATNATVAGTLQGGVALVTVQGGAATHSGFATVTFTPAANVTAVRAAQAKVNFRRINSSATSGPLSAVVIEDPGVYTWGNAALTGPALTATAPGGVVLTPVLSAGFSALTIVNGGSRYVTPPAVIFSTTSGDPGSGAAAVAVLNGKSSVDKVELLSPGSGYAGNVTIELTSRQATGVAEVQRNLTGKYLTGWRFVDAYGMPGDLCPLKVVDCAAGANAIRWNFTGFSMADGSPNRVAKIELWRTTSDQAITLYRAASLTAAEVTALVGNTYDDDLPDFMLADPERLGYAELPILTPQGLPNAFRFGVPPTNMSVVTLFNDRAWYAVDRTGAEPNTIYFSGTQEYESVPKENQIILENTGRDTDAITGLMPLGGSLYIGQRRTLTRLTTGDEPLLEAAASPVAQRGLLNDRCWDQWDGVAYLVDRHGLYQFSGGQADPISDPIAPLWSQIDFSKQAFFFVRVNAPEQVVRLYFAPTGSASAYPTSAACYSLITKAWWIEEYAVPLTCGVRLDNGEHAGTDQKLVRVSEGLTDLGASVPYVLRTGNYPIANDPKRSVRLLYTPTSTSHPLKARVYYNGSTAPRPNAITSDRGTGFVTVGGSTDATLDLASARSPLGPATGHAEAMMAGRIDDRSAGGDRHLAVELAGTQSDSPMVIHRMDVEGAG
jgi:hypothetical protein